MTLVENQMAAHSHALNGSTASGTIADPSGAIPALPSTGGANIYSTGNTDVEFATETVGETGGTAPVDVRQPYLVIGYIIALQGTFPSRA